jgi:nucleoside-diphosphate-sugar epimerase
LVDAAAAGRRLVVLGADGFIGSAVVRAALAAGAEVTGLCVKQPWRLEGVPGDRLTLSEVPGGRWWDESFEAVLGHRLGGADSYVHLGYEPPPPGADAGAREEHERLVNARGTVRVAAAAAAAEVPVVFASSADVYGAWHDAAVTEDTECEPATPYAVAKLEAERGLPGAATVLRVATVFGAGELGPRAIPSFIKAALRGEPGVLHGGGRDVKDYVGLADVAGAFLASAVTPSPEPRVLNIGSGVGRSTADVLAAVSRVLGAEARADDVPSPRSPARLVVSPGRARAELGFDPSADFDAGLRAEAAWLDANRARWE